MARPPRPVVRVNGVTVGREAAEDVLAAAGARHAFGAGMEPYAAMAQRSFIDLLGRPLRLLVLCYETPPMGGGTGVACAQVLRVLARRPDLRIDVISSGLGREIEVLRQGSATIHLLPVGKRDLNHWRPDELLRWMVGSARRAETLLRDGPFDLCHCWSGFPAGLVGWWLRHRQPYLVSLRGSDVPGYNRRLRLLEPLLLGRLARRVWRDSAGVFAVSRSLRALAQHTAADLPIGVLPNGVVCGPMTSRSGAPRRSAICCASTKNSPTSHGRSKRAGRSTPSLPKCRRARRASAPSRRGSRSSTPHKRSHRWTSPHSRRRCERVWRTGAGC